MQKGVQVCVKSVKRIIKKPSSSQTALSYFNMI